MRFRALCLLGLLPIVAWGQAALDQVVERCRKDFQVPGIAVAVVKDGKVVVAKGYGVRNIGEPAPVTPRTLFGIASNTKVFTAAALAMLVDEGKLDWDDRVVDRLPGFQMSDPYVTREMRVRDLLCHRSGLGLGAGDLMFWPASDLTDEDILHRLRFIPLATSFRSTYAYDNILYSVAGLLLKQVGGKPWEEVMRARFFVPLGMTDSQPGSKFLKPNADVATPHAPAEGKLVALPQDPSNNNAPAGAILSSAEDLSKWVRALLAQGDLGQGQRLFSAAEGGAPQGSPAHHGRLRDGPGRPGLPRDPSGGPHRRAVRDGLAGHPAARAQARRDRPDQRGGHGGL